MQPLGPDKERNLACTWRMGHKCQSSGLIELCPSGVGDRQEGGIDCQRG